MDPSSFKERSYKMAGIFINLEVDDKGTAKIVQFTDETKKAFDEMKKGPQQAIGPLKEMHDSWIAITAKIGLATAAAYAAKKMFYDTAKEIASATNAIERQAAVLGISTDEFQKWQYAAKMSDVNAQEFAIGIKLLSRNMEDASSGSGDAAKYFSAMGISVKTSEGNLRPLNDLMGEISDKFASWEDGPRKIAFALQLFGRSGETLIPLLNKGKTGFNEFAAEAQRLGIILSPDLVRKGSEAEDSFKRLGAQIEATKLSFAPAAKVAADFFGDIREMVDETKKYIKDSNLGLDFAAAAGFGPGLYFKSTEDLLKYSQLQADLLKPKPKPPQVPGKENEETAKYLEELIKNEYATWREALLEAEEQRKNREADFVNNIKGSFFNFQQALSTGWVYPTGEGEIKLEKYIELVDDARISLGKIKIIGDEFRWDKENYFPVPGEVKGLGEKMWKEAEETRKAWEETAYSITSIWSQDLSAMLDGTENFTQGVKKILLDMSKYAIDQFAKMAAQWLIFDSLTKSGSGWGTKGQTGYGGFVQFFGSLIGSLGKQEGGIFTRPTPAIIGEAGPEAVVPLKHGAIPIETKGGGNMTVYVINNSSRTETTTRESGDGRGNRRVDVVISDIVSKESRRYGSPMNQSIQSMGGRNQLIRR